MDKVSGKLTVFFEDPFWVGVFEHIEDEKLSVAKVMILSILVDTFISKISLPMQPVPEIGSISGA